MDAQFWHERWAMKEIGFHEGEVNSLLLHWFDSLSLTPGDRVFLPLCGKTRDIAWLLAQGYSVVGVELSEIAVKELFEELGVQPTITKVDQYLHYHSENLDVYVGDIFDMTPSIIGQVAGVYDRAALVALPLEMRKQYTKLLLSITACAPQLLVCYEYDQSIFDGPPFSISREEIRQHYADSLTITLLESREMEGCIRGQVDATERVWLLSSLSE
ncbi:thiopurine S-methyltransferase [Litoribrevibacter albus]|uniref:Thiopurine S-methyltransferase n=1 Tax=Litoribrevibacter albus TaxID=1473156 RepID=A0AA37W6P9_9GAMM|nr:thiopurine S-methyltransferase [Litoribrevibacter albus]GLQ30418.1 thiopurine S-methyltransferase [Litoribrevibacter albus]